MSTVDTRIKKSVREAFGNKLAELGRQNENIVVLDADLSCSTQTKIFAKEFPNRFFNCGIAEQDMLTTASGLALAGKVAFVASFATFVTGRAYDQIRVSVCYQNLNVKIVGTHGGITVGEDGATHQALEDVSLMRGLPNMTVIVPADYRECEQAVEYAATHDGPCYIRVSRTNLPDVYSEDYKFNPYKAVVLREGTDVTLISNGDVLVETLNAAELLAKHGINTEVISLPVIKPLDKDTIIKSVQKTNLAITVENHSIYGGIGSTVAECLSENCPAKLVRIGVNDEFGQSGTSGDLLAYYHLDAEGIKNRVLEEL